MEIQIIVFIAIFSFTWISTACVPVHNETGSNANIKYVGSVDGKSFFVQQTPLMTWQEAKGNCTASGMRLASITSTQQRTLLNQAFDNVTVIVGKELWTSGRDATTTRQFVWDSSRTSLNENVVSNFFPATGMLACLTIYSNDSFMFHSHSCTVRLGAICEINYQK